MTADQHTGRRVVANISLSLDGRVNGAAGEYDMGWIVPHAISDAARDHMVRVTGIATTALLGRKNFDGFGGYWPGVADDENADPRDRAFSSWLNTTEKIVFSHTSTDSPWANTRITDVEPAKEVAQLRTQDGGDIVILASSSVIRALLAADEIDRLSITQCPTVVGGGAALFDDGMPASNWSLVDVTTTDSGALCLLYDRVRST